jgi:hypothetical protein
MGLNLFNTDGGPLTPYKGSPADIPMSPYPANLEMPSLDLNILVPIPSKPVTKQTAPAPAPHKGRKDSDSDSSDDDDNPDRPKRETGLINDLIERFLEEQPITKEEWDSIRKEEQIILDCLIKRKLGFDIHEYIKCKGNLKEGAVKCKRLEENYKMVFKGALKYLSGTFKEKKGKKKSKAEDIAFYQHYFGSVVNDSNPLETFFHPNK